MNAKERRTNERRGEMRRGECRREGARRSEDANDDFLLPDIDTPVPVRAPETAAPGMTVHLSPTRIVLVVAACLTFVVLGFVLGQYAK